MSFPCLCYSRKVSLPILDPRDRFSLRTRCPNVDFGWYPVLASANPGLCILHLDLGAHLVNIESLIFSYSASNLLRLLVYALSKNYILFLFCRTCPLITSQILTNSRLLLSIAAISGCRFTFYAL